MKTNVRENPDKISQNLANHPFVAGLAPNYVQLLMDCATEVSFAPGEEILYEGAEANEFYLICKGKVALGIYTAGFGFTTVQTVNPDELVGWSWLMPPHHWHFGAKAITPVQAVALDGKYLREKCEENHDFGYEILKRLSLIIGQRLRESRMEPYVSRG